VFAVLDQVGAASWGEFGEAGPVSPQPFVCPIADFYRTDPVSRASATMAECSEIFVEGRGGAPTRTGTHG
jgi:NADH-quinone oxidoreductase subunit G